ncbi:beta-adaptin, partial [Nowakowskiella sp. JEL0078]
METTPKPKFFSTTKKGENFELKADLNSEYKEKRKETVKKVIANMTIGKDVSSLFADVVKNMQTDDLELKKLVYLYLINYAKSQPELVILAINTFVKDSDDSNPLIRALAIRTMGCLRVEKIVDYLMEPLKKGLRDEDPYVRKTAVLCVAKLFDLNPSIAIDNNLVTFVQDMLSDRNPMVIANAVAALSEISEAAKQKDVFSVNSAILVKLLAALNECTEWGQINILEALSIYRPVDSREASEICERVIPRLQHVNASVVMSAVRVLIIYLNYIESEELIKNMIKKLAPPLVTLLSAQPEIQYVALRNINIILQKRPEILSQEMRVFFTKYNDPPYVKLEKLEVMVKLASEKNIDQVLSELKEYASEVDIDFVRKSVTAIGRCAIKIDAASDRCVNVLLELIKTKVNHIVQESIVVIKDIFRKYPSKYEGIIPTLCENLEVFDEPIAKASLIWIVGEYAERIENATELLEYFIENFREESSVVQLQLISATVKLFLKKPQSAQEIVQKVLQAATQGCDNPDIRDRAYIYWRLLSSNPQAAKTVVISEKPPIEAVNNTVNDSLATELIFHIATLASVYQKSPSLLGATSVAIRTVRDEDTTLENAEEDGAGAAAIVAAAGGNIENLLDLDFSVPVVSPVSITSPPKTTSGIDDLLGLMDMPNAPPSHPIGLGLGGLGIAPQQKNLMSGFGFDGLTSEFSSMLVSKSVYLAENAAQGLSVL